MKEYTVTIDGLEHTVLLDEDEAKRIGAKRVGSSSIEDKAIKPASTTKKS